MISYLLHEESTPVRRAECVGSHKGDDAVYQNEESAVRSATTSVRAAAVVGLESGARAVQGGGDEDLADLIAVDIADLDGCAEVIVER